MTTKDAGTATSAPTYDIDDAYDAITLQLERADSLTGLLAQRLSDLHEQLDAPNELYALSLIADAVSEKLQLILDNARAWHAAANSLKAERP
jgi:hypothetical protein